jgi:hypothetical protein
MKRSLKAPKTTALAVRPKAKPLERMCLTGGIDNFAAQIGGKPTFIDMCRWSQSPPVKELVRHWDGLTQEQKDTIPLRHLCQRLGIDRQWLMNESVAAFSRVQSMAAQLKCAAALPKLMEASIQVALKRGPEALREQELQFMMAGFLGQTKTS